MNELRASLMDFFRRVGRRLRTGRGSNLSPEEFLLEEAVVVAPIAPGMAGKVEVRKNRTAAEVFARAEDPAQAFARGARVRLIDYRDSVYLVEPADEEHLVH
jgi:hypothetical protein